MSVISLITDFGLRDNFVGVMKAVILKINPGVQLIDICHNIKPQDILEAAFLLKGSYGFFPFGTIHLVVVDPGVGSKRKKILVETKNYLFVAPDNGVLSLVLEDEVPVKIIEITNEKYFLKPVSHTFHGRDIFAPVAAYISKQAPIDDFGPRMNSYETLRFPEVKITSKSLCGEIIHIDHFGNLISNIDKDTLEDFIKTKKFRIWIEGKTIDKLSRSYREGRNLKPLALIDSFNFLEIAVNRASARDLVGADKGTAIKVTKR